MAADGRWFALGMFSFFFDFFLRFLRFFLATRCFGDDFWSAVVSTFVSCFGFWSAIVWLWPAVASAIGLRLIGSSVDSAFGLWMFGFGLRLLRLLVCS